MGQSELLKGLTLHGYDSERSFDESEFNQERIEEIRMVVRMWFRKMRAINLRWNSYYLKHSVERYLGGDRIWNGTVSGHIANGELIYAMILEGFDVLKDGQYALFNISEIDFCALCIAGSRFTTHWYLPHTHVTLRRLLEVEPDSAGNYQACRYHIVRKGGFEKYRTAER